MYSCGSQPEKEILTDPQIDKVFELPSGSEVKSYEREKMDNIVFVDITADGKYVVGQAESSNFKITDVMTGEVIFLAENIKPQDATLNKDKNTVAIACADWTIKVFDLAKNAQTLNLQEHKNSVESVCYTPDGKYLLSSAKDCQLKIWDLTGKLLLTVVGLEKMTEYEGETKDFVVFAPNGRYDGTEAGIAQVIYFEKGGERLPASTYKEQCYTKNLLGRTLGQSFIEFASEAK